MPGKYETRKPAARKDPKETAASARSEIGSKSSQNSRAARSRETVQSGRNSRSRETVQSGGASQSKFSQTIEARATQAIYAIQDRDHNASDKKRTVSGNVSYYSGEELSRSPFFPKRFLPVLLIFAILGAAIGVVLFYQYYETAIGSSSRSQAAMENILSEEVSYEFPVLADIVEADTGITAYCDDEGLTYSEIGEPVEEARCVFKYPSGVETELGFELYNKGIGNLSSEDTAKLYYGGWEMDTDSSNGFTIHIKYVDFKSDSLETALSECLRIQGIDSSTASDRGTDNSGNTYVAGTLEIDSRTFEWRASAILMSSMYKTVLPKNAALVGFRLTES